MDPQVKHGFRMHRVLSTLNRLEVDRLDDADRDRIETARNLLEAVRFPTREGRRENGSGTNRFLRSDANLSGMYDSILVATDGSEDAAEAVQVAIELSGQFDAVLHVLYVMDSDLARTSASKDAYEQAGTEILQRAHQQAAAQGVSVTTALELGSPAAVVLDYAETAGVDLIVVGGKDKSTVERFLIGSAVEKITRHAPVSVLTVRRS